MPDPLDTLPPEIWDQCIEMAIDGQQAGPLELTMVSTHWQNLLINVPSLWRQIYIQNEEDEFARISTFLHLSKGRPLSVYITTGIAPMSALKLVSAEFRRITNISITSHTRDTPGARSVEHWKNAASDILATLFNGLMPSDMIKTPCFGISLRENNQPYYHVVHMQFIVKISTASMEERRRMACKNDPKGYFITWKQHIESVIRNSAAHDTRSRIRSIDSIVGLTPYVRLHSAIKATIPLLIKLLMDKDRMVQLCAVEAIEKLSDHPELHYKIANTIPSLMKLLQPDRKSVV